MKEIIERLRTEANENIADGESIWSVKVSNREALQITDALEVATFPPIVKVALSVLQHLNETKRGISYLWATIDKDQDLRLTCNEPVFNENEQEWDADGVRSYINIRMQNFHFNTKDMLFHRTANGWEWYGNPNKQNIEQHGK